MHPVTPPVSAFTRIARAAAVLVLPAFAPMLPLHAQTHVGMVGTRYVEASVFFENIRERGIDDGLGFGLRANVPLHPALDLALYGSQENIDTNDFRERTAYATLMAHWAARDFTPYVAGSVGQVWQSAVVEDVKYSEDESAYAILAGVEAPIGDRTALDLHVAYNDYFSSDAGSFWVYTVGVNTWFTDKVGATAAVSFRDSDSTIFTLGAVLRF